ncbi:hypothetical protein, partial [Micromonospora sp. CV4]|uniref:hypothetical protein n=1 Tax=Micromonospora sp. CV4 TaxID=2478711 RepID=UPI000F1944B0
APTRTAQVTTPALRSIAGGDRSPGVYRTPAPVPAAPVVPESSVPRPLRRRGALTVVRAAPGVARAVPRPPLIHPLGGLAASA